MFLRQSTSQVVRFGPCLDKTNGVTEETSLTLAQGDMRLSKDGAAFAQKNASGNATHDSDGWYYTTLNATDTNTCGELILNVHQPANMLPVWVRWYVVEESIYDSLFAASAAGIDANQRVEVGAVLGTSQTAGDLAALIATVDSVADGIQTDLSNGTDGLGAIKGAVDAIPTSNPTASAIADAVLDEALSGHTSGGSLGKAVADIESDATAILADTNELQSDDVPGLIAALDTVVDRVEADTTAILADTNELQTDDVPGLIAALDTVVDRVEADTTAILADTNELQTDDVPGLIAALDTLIDAIKAKTDSMTYTKSNELDVNTKSINGATVVGDGNATPWDGA